MCLAFTAVAVWTRSTLSSLSDSQRGQRMVIATKWQSFREISNRNWGLNSFSWEFGGGFGNRNGKFNNLGIEECNAYGNIMRIGIIRINLMNTSNTAQGGGGSFKNRWTQRWLELCFLEWLQWLQWSPGRSPHPQLLDAVWCSSAVVVVVA